jgi:Lantibiotic biosynthesis dehydratase C-term
MEHWIEINLSAKARTQDLVLLRVLRPYVEELRRKGELVTYHFFREPEIRFRVRLRRASVKAQEAKALSRIAESLVRRRLVTEWHFGNHGDVGGRYVGEEERYGKNGWKVAQDYFQSGSEAAMKLLELRDGGLLESPLWSRGLGNPWEGGGRNPWREKVEDPLAYHWSRYVHLFTNQLGFDIDDEVKLCRRQAEGYKRVSGDFGMKW